MTALQGARAHWSSENTAMHVVRSNGGHVLIDEIDLVRPLCAIHSETLISSTHRTLQTYVLGTAIASPSWTTFMYGMVVVRWQQNGPRPSGMHRVWPSRGPR